ncbi:unnamed protein product [Rhizophagus irregularis]|uniref:PX domain-containing protein n=1 Tax=Rhizophagus irregularis TaxID=588596 RepID=A0A2N1N373_9GLOM|nr:hypothetical protein RhiirC2_750368 [Rhizophagus irregularis]CAB4377807.1 unnamed protein product [Rhizophagus irregularis]CAB5394573.1 unnamed protein product [Rhizophagus irregularis]
MSTMTSLIIEVPVMIGAIEFTRMILFDPLAKIAFPYFKTVENEVNGYTTYLKYITAVTFYYLLVNNFLLLPLYFLQIFIGFILVFTILCNFTPLWEIFMTSFKFTDFYSIFTMERTSIVENFNNVMMGELIINSKQQQQQRNLQLDIYSNLKKKNFQFNQNFQPDAIIVMNADILVKLNRLLSIPTHKSKPTHYQTYRKHRSRNMNFLPTYYSNEKLSIPRRRKNSNLLICDSQDQFKSSDNLKEIHVAPPSDLFLSEKINELDKKLVDLTEHENLARKLIKQQKQSNQIDGIYEITKKIQGLIGQIKRIDIQRQQYQVQVQENIISKDVTKLSIPAFTVKQENYKKFAVYIIMVQRIDASTGKAKAGWIVPRRYNEFSSLNQQLKNHYSEFVDKFEFPGKTLFNSLNNTFLESRRVQLENYLQGLLSNDEICEDRDFLKFLSKEN